MIQLYRNKHNLSVIFSNFILEDSFSNIVRITFDSDAKKNSYPNNSYIKVWEENFFRIY